MKAVPSGNPWRGGFFVSGICDSCYAPPMERKSDIPEDPAEHAVQFSADWCDRPEIQARDRLKRLGIPDDQIGAVDRELGGRVAAFHPKEETGGGISPGRRINLNSGVFNPDLLR